MTRPRTGRARNHAARQAILAAALAEVNERGFAETTVEGIAARAHAGKQTIYRWWPSPSHLLLEALLETANAEIPEVDTGTLRGDLVDFLDATLHQSADRTVLVALMARALLDEAFAEAFRQQLLTPRRDALRRVLARAVDRGEVSRDEDLDLLIDVIHGFLWHRLQLQRAPLDHRAVIAITDLITRAAAL